MGVVVGVVVIMSRLHMQGEFGRRVRNYRIHEGPIERTMILSVLTSYSWYGWTAPCEAGVNLLLVLMNR